MAPVSKLSDSEVALQAAIDGDLRLLKKMARNANLREAKDRIGRNAPHFAAGKGHLDVCRWNAGSLRRGQRRRESPGVPARPWRRPRVPDAKGSTPLHDAAEQGHCEAVRLLLSKGVDVDPVNYRGTPLHLAAAKDRDQVVKILLEHGADPNKVVNHVFSPLMMACCGHSLKCMKLLVQAGADVNFISPSGPSILMEAVDDHLTDIVKFLLEAGADPNIADEDGKLPIMCAAVHGHRELVEILLPKTRPIPYVPDWSVDGIIRTMKYLRFGAQLNTRSERCSPARFKVYLQSESCGSSPASGSMELEYEMFPTDPMDTRRRILLALHNIKFANRNDQWRATDPYVLERVQGTLHTVHCNLTIDDIKEHVTALENDVKLHLARDHYISEDWHTYIAVFDYVTPDYIQDTPPTQLVDTDNVANESNPGKKIKMTCNAESTNSGKSDSSIGERFSNLMEDKEIAAELFKGRLSMENCCDKAMRCGFKGKELRCVINLCRLNWEQRQIFMKLEDSEAKDYALEAIYGFVPPPLPPPPTQ